MAGDTALIKAQRHLVSGRVQGVFFRASTRQQALQLRLTGYAKNLPDGRVEVIAVGEPIALQKLLQWLWQGPPAASVTDVQSVDIEVAVSEYAAFTTL
jgi:acylphosphatase